MKKKLSCFKAYDIRGKIPDDIDNNLVYLISIAYAEILTPKKIIVGYDARLESPELASFVIKGLIDSGVDVINLGLCGTEEVYFNTFFNEANGVDGGIMITASHNPKGFNGLKMVKKGSHPMSWETGLELIHDRVLQLLESRSELKFAPVKGNIIFNNNKLPYIKHILQYIKYENLKPLRIVVNPGNGPAGQVIKLLEEFVPFKFIYLNEKPDGNFPNGVPNPMVIENRKETSDFVLKHQADFGIAWDGDFDRCFLFDEKGNFIDGYYLVGLLAESFLEKSPNEKIVHDQRLVWNTLDTVKKYGGTAIVSKSGHSFIKEKMRQENAIYGGEMSAHHYFRDFAYCDSGMIPWLLVSELLSVSNMVLSELVQNSINLYPCSGEINYEVDNVVDSIKNVEEYFIKEKAQINYIDGISIEFKDWRFNLRGSNTEPLLRLNLETRGNFVSIQQKVAEIESILKNK